MSVSVSHFLRLTLQVQQPVGFVFDVGMIEDWLTSMWTSSVACLALHESCMPRYLTGMCSKLGVELAVSAGVELEAFQTPVGVTFISVVETLKHMSTLFILFPCRVFTYW